MSEVLRRINCILTLIIFDFCEIRRCIYDPIINKISYLCSALICIVLAAYFYSIIRKFQNLVIDSVFDEKMD